MRFYRREDDRNYLRVRGEYSSMLSGHGETPELPPRARRIRKIVNMHRQAFGTTSACAENTVHSAGASYRSRNYLRVRGEYTRRRASPIIGLELPPRARRIPVEIIRAVPGAGTTSACAENTKPPHPHAHPTGNYLRVRGEYF